MRIFLDANILFSAAKTDGAVRQLLRLLCEQGHECCVDAYVLDEARRNLAAKGPQGLAVLDALLPFLHLTPHAPGAELSAQAEWLPEKCRPMLGAAIRLGCDVLVTGDSTHFGAGYGKAFEGVAIHSPRSLAEWLFTDVR